MLDQVLEVQPQLPHRLAGLLGEAQAEELAGQVRPRQELRREVSHNASVVLGVRFPSPHALLKHAVADGQGQRGIGVVARRSHRHAAESAEEVVQKRLFQVRDAIAGADADGRRNLAGAGTRRLFRFGHKRDVSAGE